MSPAVVSVIVSVTALVVSAGTAVLALRQRRRQELAAITADLYPVLRQLRDSAWQWAKPLGGMAPDHVIAMHNGLVDLIDLAPAIVDPGLIRSCRALLEHDAAGVALSIDPPRFHGSIGGDTLVEIFNDFGRSAHEAVQRCEGLRRRAA